MKEKFSFDPASENITIDISISTPGLANTHVYKKMNGNEKSMIGESSPESGSIHQLNIGDITNLEETSIAVQTWINFGTINKKLWPQLLKTIFTSYTVKDNLGNQKIFTHDADDIIVSSNGKTVIIVKLISFQKKFPVENLN